MSRPWTPTVTTFCTRVHTPYTATAVVEKPMSRELTSTPMTDTTPCITAAGMPTRKMATKVLSSGRKVKEMGVAGLKRRLIRYPATQPTHWPTTVAMAAPAVPRAGRPK